MVGGSEYVSCLALAKATLRTAKLNGCCVVECGTWKGGMSAGLIETCGRNRDYFFFDSFEGLPAVTVEDGEAAHQWQTNTTGEHYFDNCTASLAEFLSVVRMTRLAPERLHVYKGQFDSTLPHVKMPSIGILRIDADWYSSTMVCLEQLWDQVASGGIIVIDDYFAWEGCRKALHRFLGSRLCVEAIQQTSFAKVAFIKKGQSPNSYSPTSFKS